MELAKVRFVAAFFVSLHKNAIFVLPIKNILLMGSYISACGVKSAEIKAIFGSKDKTLLQKIRANKTFQYNVNETPETIQALTEMIMGNPYTLEGYHYSYTFIGICKTFGTELPYDEDIKSGYCTSLIDRALLEDWGIEVSIDFELFPKKCFPSHLIKKTYEPMISLLDEEHLKALANLLDKVHKTPEEIDILKKEDEKGYAYYDIMGLKENIAFCLENKLDMALFCY